MRENTVHNTSYTYYHAAYSDRDKFNPHARVRIVAENRCRAIDVRRSRIKTYFSSSQVGVGKY